MGPCKYCGAGKVAPARKIWAGPENSGPARKFSGRAGPANFSDREKKIWQFFFEMYEKLDTGSKVEIEYARAGKKMQAAFEKPNMQGRMKMRMN